MERAEVTLGQAWQEALKGRAIARAAWGPDRPPVRAVPVAGEDVLIMGRRPAVAMDAGLTGEDMDAEDWMVLPGEH
jgi:hypothetical protein